MLQLVNIILLSSAFGTLTGQNDKSWTASDFGSMETWISTSSYVYHLEADLYRPGYVLFADRYSLRTSKGTSTLSVAGYPTSRGNTFSSSTSARFGYIYGFAQVNSTSVIVSDYSYHCLKHFHRPTKAVTPFAGTCGRTGHVDSTSPLFYYPRGVLLHQRTLFLSDYSNRAVRTVDIDTKETRTLYSNSNFLPMSLALSADKKHLFVTDTGADRVVILDRESGTLLNTTADYFTHPADLALVIPDVPVIADYSKRQLIVMDLHTNTTTSICTGSARTFDGDVNSCNLYYPHGLTLINSTLYIGSYCSIRKIDAPKEVNECALNLHDCGKNSVCTDTPHSWRCDCKPGFKKNGTCCYDIDECELNTHQCSDNARCMNTPGSYVCICKEGYSGDGLTCTAHVCPGNVTGLLQGVEKQHSEVSLTAGDVEHVMRLPKGIFKFDIKLPLANCTTYVHVLDPTPPEKRLVFSAMYKKACKGMRKDGFSKIVIEGITQYYYHTISQICGCKTFGGVPDIKCNDGDMTVTWFTHTVLDSSQPNFDESSAELLNKTRTSIQALQDAYGVGLMRMTAMNLSPPVVYPSRDKHGVVLQPGLELACHEYLKYNATGDFCVYK